MLKCLKQTFSSKSRKLHNNKVLHKKDVIMWWLIAILSVILLYFTFSHLGSKPLYHRGVRLSGFKKYIDNLFLRGEPGSFIVIEHEDSDRFLQLALRDVSGNFLSFELGFPKVIWSAPYYDSVAQVANELGLDVNEEPGLRADPVTTFMRISKKDSYPAVLELACELINRVCRTIELGDSTKFTVHFEGDFTGSRAWVEIDRDLEKLPPEKAIVKLSRWQARRKTQKE